MLRLIRTRPFLRLRPQLAQLARHYSIPPTQFQKGDDFNPPKPPKPSRSRWKVGTAAALILAFTAFTAFMVTEVEYPREFLQERVQHYKKALETADPKETFNLQSRLFVQYTRLKDYQAAFDLCVEILASPNTPLYARPYTIFNVLGLATLKEGEEAFEYQPYPNDQVMDNLRQATQLAQKEIIRQCPETAELFRDDISDKELCEVATKLREKGDFEAWKPFREHLMRARYTLCGMIQHTDINKSLKEERRTYWMRMASGAEKPELVAALGIYYMIRCNPIINLTRFGQQTPVADIGFIMLHEDNKRLLEYLLMEIASATPEERNSNELKLGEAAGKIGVALGEIMDGRVEQGRAKLVEAKALAIACDRDGFAGMVDNYISEYLDKKEN